MQIGKERKTAMTPKEAAKFNRKNVRITCKDGYTREGKCYMETELDDDDELKVYLEIKYVDIPLEDVAEIAEIAEVDGE